MQIKNVSLIELLLLCDEVLENYPYQFGLGTRVCDVYMNMSKIDGDLHTEVFVKKECEK